MMIVTKFPTFLLRSSHSGRKFIDGRAPLASSVGWRGRSTAGPTSLPPGVLSFLSEAREVSGSEAARAQQTTMPVVGFMNTLNSTESASDLVAAFRQGLGETGYAE